MKLVLDLPFSYKSIATPKRSRKPREIRLVGVIPLEIPEIRIEDAPIAIEADVEYEFVRDNDSWQREMKHVTYRQFRGQLLRPLDIVFKGRRIPAARFTVPVEDAREAMRQTWKEMTEGTDCPFHGRDDAHYIEFLGPEDGFSGTIHSSERDVEVRWWTNFIADHGFAVIDGLIWQRTGLPGWGVGFEYTDPHLKATARKGTRRYLRLLPDCSSGSSFLREAVFFDKDLADLYFKHYAADEARRAAIGREKLEISTDRGGYLIVDDLPFIRDDRLELIANCIKYTVRRQDSIPKALQDKADALLALIDARRQSQTNGIDDLVNALIGFGNDVDTAIQAAEKKTYNFKFVDHCLKLLTILDGLPPKPDDEPETFIAHRARRAKGYHTLPRQALIGIRNDKTDILVTRDDFRRISNDREADVHIWKHAFDVDGLPAYVRGSLTAIQSPWVSTNPVRSLEQELANLELDRLAKCDWETWRRGAGTVMRPEGTGTMAARIYFRRDWESTLYIFPIDGPHLQARLDLAKIGEAKAICEAALEAYGYGNFANTEFALDFGPVEH